jgi:methionyl aminopeptidase
MIVLKSAEEIAGMREAGRLTAQLMQELSTAVAPGVSTADLDKVAKAFVARHRAVPTFLNYQGYPACICTSVNEQVVHGIPGPRKLKEGDLVSLDIGVTLNGWVGDMARTFAVGKASPKVLDLMRVTEECLRLGIAQAQVGGYLHDIGHAVESHAEALGYGVVREYCGHGIGHQMHEAPQVPNYGSAGSGVRLKAGMTIAIEPMINTGAWETRQLDDGWTVVTADGGLSAHFEDTIAITEHGPEVLTSL